MVAVSLDLKYQIKHGYYKIILLCLLLSRFILLAREISMMLLGLIYWISTHICILYFNFTDWRGKPQRGPKILTVTWASQTIYKPFRTPHIRFPPFSIKVNWFVRHIRLYSISSHLMRYRSMSAVPPSLFLNSLGISHTTFIIFTCITTEHNWY